MPALLYELKIIAYSFSVALELVECTILNRNQ